MFTEGEGDGNDSRLSSEIFSTLKRGKIQEFSQRKLQHPLSKTQYSF